jgi:hypothetical protein
MPTRYVNTASSAGGDGTTNGTAGATRAYASLAEWEAARQASLSDVEECICEGTAADTAAVDIDGWTTTASFYIDVKAVAGAGRHSGVWSASHYRLTVASDFGGALTLREAYARFTGLQVENTSGDGSYCMRFIAAATAANSFHLVESCILRDADGASPANRAGLYAADGTLDVRNTVSYGNGGAGFYVDLGDGVSLAATFRNCVAANNTGAGFHCQTASGTQTLQNCYSGGNTGADISTNWDVRTTCRTEDGSQSSTTAAYSTSSGCYFTNITPGSEDFHIGSSSELLAIGTDLSATFTTDIDGQTRSSPWSVGVDHIGAAVRKFILTRPAA